MDALPVKAFEPRIVCTRCGLIGAEVRPNWMGLRADQDAALSKQ
jgi:hypothetical protein